MLLGAECLGDYNIKQLEARPDHAVYSLLAIKLLGPLLVGFMNAGAGPGAADAGGRRKLESSWITRLGCWWGPLRAIDRASELQLLASQPASSPADSRRFFFSLPTNLHDCLTTMLISPFRLR